MHRSVSSVLLVKAGNKIQVDHELIRRILNKPEATGKLSSWRVRPSEIVIDIVYLTRRNLQAAVKKFLIITKREDSTTLENRSKSSSYLKMFRMCGNDGNTRPVHHGRP